MNMQYTCPSPCHAPSCKLQDPAILSIHRVPYSSRVFLFKCYKKINLKKSCGVSRTGADTPPAPTPTLQPIWPFSTAFFLDVAKRMAKIKLTILQRITVPYNCEAIQYSRTNMCMQSFKDPFIYTPWFILSINPTRFGIIMIKYIQPFFLTAIKIRVGDKDGRVIKLTLCIFHYISFIFIYTHVYTIYKTYAFWYYYDYVYIAIF